MNEVFGADSDSNSDPGAMRCETSVEIIGKIKLTDTEQRPGSSELSTPGRGSRM